jgi:hypothetical protein
MWLIAYQSVERVYWNPILIFWLFFFIFFLSTVSINTLQEHKEHKFWCLVFRFCGNLVDNREKVNRHIYRNTENAMENYTYGNRGDTIFQTQLHCNLTLTSSIKMKSLPCFWSGHSDLFVANKRRQKWYCVVSEARSEVARVLHSQNPGFLDASQSVASLSPAACTSHWLGQGAQNPMLMLECLPWNFLRPSLCLRLAGADKDTYYGSERLYLPNSVSWNVNTHADGFKRWRLWEVIRS